MGIMGWGNFVGSIGSFTYFGAMLYFFPTALWLIFIPLLVFTGFNIFAGIRFYKQLDEDLSYESFRSSQETTVPIVMSIILPLQLAVRVCSPCRGRSWADPAQSRCVWAP